MWTRVDFDGLLHNNFHVGGPFSMDHSACLISRGTDSLFVLDSFQRCLYRKWPGNIRIMFVWNREYIYLPVCTVQSLSRVQHFETHGLQHARLPCPSPACSNSCPSSQWCHPIISSSVIPFSSCLQSFPVSGSFQWVSYLHQVAKSFSQFIHLMNIQDWFPLGWIGLISLQSKELSRVLSTYEWMKAFICLFSNNPPPPN